MADKKKSPPKNVAEIRIPEEDERLLDEAWDEVKKDVLAGKYKDYYERMRGYFDQDKGKKDKDKKDKDKKDKDKKDEKD